MSLSRAEQEIHISASRDEEFATAYCSDSVWMNKLDKLVEKSPKLFTVVKVTSVGKTYRFPKKLISIRSSVVKREFSDEERQAMAERLRLARKSKQAN